uniref:Putative kinesin-like protein n=2 Tax=Helianthus annuus TaxID=4232 RepID=A0A251U4H8_HELAN
MATSSSRGPVSSSFYNNNKPSSPFSSSSSFKQTVPQSFASASTFYGGSGNSYGSRSENFNLTTSDSMYSRGGYGALSPVDYPSADEMIDEPIDDVPRSGGGDSIFVTIRFRPLSEREYQRGDEVAWYADGDKLVRNEYNPATSYAFGTISGVEDDDVIGKENDKGVFIFGVF